MLTLLVRISLLAELAAYVALGAWLHARTAGDAARRCAAAVVRRSSLRLALVFSPAPWLDLPLAARSRRIASGPRHRAPAVGEYAALRRRQLLYLPFESVAVRPDPAPLAGARARDPVHGYLSNRGYFRPMLAWLEARGVGPVFVPNYRSVSLDDRDRRARRLHEEIERIAAGTGQRVILGVPLAWAGSSRGATCRTTARARIARLVTIASPHHGTELARFGIGSHARQMVRGSAFLRALARAEEARPPTVPSLSLYTVHDNLVSPQDTSRLPWARNVAVSGVGHLASWPRRRPLRWCWRSCVPAGRRANARRRCDPGSARAILAVPRETRRRPVTGDTDLAAQKARLAEDFGKVVSDTEALLRSLASVGGDKAAAVRESVEANLASAKARLRELQGEAADRAASAARDADAYVRANPWHAVGLAAAVGVIVGLIIGNRR
jgi:ElaB/YqjD/DUF883 family membrane-anchored ribosome-binding protein